MGKQTFSDDGQFIPIPGITTYKFVVVGPGGGGASYTQDNYGSGPGGAGGKGAVVKTTFTNVTSPVNIKIGGGGEGGLSINNYAYGGGGGLTQAFNTSINIIAAGGSGAAVFDNYQKTVNNGLNGGTPAGESLGSGSDKERSGGQADGMGGRNSSLYVEVFGGGNGGSFNPNGNGGAGGVVTQNDNGGGGGGGGGGAGINGVTGAGGFIAGYAAGGRNGGGSAGGGDFSGAGGSAGFGGGAGGPNSTGGAVNPGNSGSSTVLYNGKIITGPTVVYDVAPYNGLQYGLGGLGGTQDQPNGLMGKDGYVEISWAEPVPDILISDICFPAGTPIKTDQGIIAIEHLQPSVHTIDRQRIQCITQTKSVDPYLICFEKNALDTNYPTQKTIMSKDHKIVYEGKLLEAYRFLEITYRVKKVKYSGETLYNVLLETYGIMKVNNLECETLHPQNAIAKLYLTTLKKQTFISEASKKILHQN